MRLHQTDQNTECEDYKIGDKVLVKKDGILCKSESKYDKDPQTVSQVHTNGTIRIQRQTKSERLNIRRVTPFLRKFNDNNYTYV